MALVLNEQNFAEEIKEWVVLVDFWAEWCGPCQMMTPILEELSTVMEGKAKVGKVNVDDNPSLSAQFRVMSIPTLLIFKDGQPVDQMVWVQQVDALKEAMEKHM